MARDAPSLNPGRGRGEPSCFGGRERRLNAVQSPGLSGWVAETEGFEPSIPFGGMTI